jgi:hypothetical protein
MLINTFSKSLQHIHDLCSYERTRQLLPDIARDSRLYLGELSGMHTAIMDYHGESIDRLQVDQPRWPASFATQFDQLSANSIRDWPTNRGTIWTTGLRDHTQHEAATGPLRQGWRNEEVPAQPPQPRLDHDDWEVELRPMAYAPSQSLLFGSLQNEASHGPILPPSSAGSTLFHSGINGTTFPTIPSNTVIVDNHSINTINTIMNYCPCTNASEIVGGPQSDENAQSEVFTLSLPEKDRSAQSHFVQSSRGQSHGSLTITNGKFVRHAAGEYRHPS